VCSSDLKMAGSRQVFVFSVLLVLIAAVMQSAALSSNQARMAEREIEMMEELAAPESSLEDELIDVLRELQRRTSEKRQWNFATTPYAYSAYSGKPTSSANAYTTGAANPFYGYRRANDKRQWNFATTPYAYSAYSGKPTSSANAYTTGAANPFYGYRRSNDKRQWNFATTPYAYSAYSGKPTAGGSAYTTGAANPFHGYRRANEERQWDFATSPYASSAYSGKPTAGGSPYTTGAANPFYGYRRANQKRQWNFGWNLPPGFVPNTQASSFYSGLPKASGKPYTTGAANPFFGYKRRVAY